MNDDREIKVSGGVSGEKLYRIHAMARVNKSLYGEAGEQIYSTVLKKILEDPAGASRQTPSRGRKEHPFDYRQVLSLQLINEHHATCIQTKVSSTVGLGFLTESELKLREQRAKGEEVPWRPVPDWEQSKCEIALDPLCVHSWQDTIDDTVEDLWQCGPGFVEVVRQRSDSKVIGVHHTAAPNVHVYEEDAANWHYEVQAENGTMIRMAEFDDTPAFEARASRLGLTNLLGVQSGTYSEIIHFRRPSSISRIYGFPDWLSAGPAIELLACLKQFKFDFFNNRGVPEYMLFLIGTKIDGPDWDKITNALNANIGMGNSHKSVAVNLTDREMEVILHKLDSEGSSNDSLDKMNESYQVAVVTAHGVPPLLAGILIPGKLGAANELPNALQLFQATRIGPVQRLVQMKLGATLGSKSAGLGLTPRDFTPRRVTDYIDLATMDTTSRMRESIPDAKARGRDVSKGLRE